MATRRTKKAEAEVTKDEAPACPPKKPAPKAAPKPAINATELSRFLQLKEGQAKADDLQKYLNAACLKADEYIGKPGAEGHHLYKQGVLHLSAKFYAAGTTHLENATDVPLVCRHFFELAKRELSGSAK